MAVYDRRLPATHLKRCKLWEGSPEQLDFQFGGIRQSRVIQRVLDIESCDDLTPDEVEYLEALRLTLGRQ